MKYLKSFNESLLKDEWFNDDRTELDCSDNELSSLPKLPSCLKYINCAYNELTKLPELPDSLEKLKCGNNELTKLPELPETLTMIHCSDNLLTELPKLPVGLKNLYCFNNLLTELPELPDSLEGLYCTNNNWSKPIKFEYVDRFGIEIPLKEYEEYYIIYNQEQIDRFSSYQFQKEFLEREPENYKDLEPFGYANGIKEEFSYLFDADDMGLMFTNNK